MRRSFSTFSIDSVAFRCTCAPMHRQCRLLLWRSSNSISGIWNHKPSRSTLTRQLKSFHWQHSAQEGKTMPLEALKPLEWFDGDFVAEYQRRIVKIDGVACRLITI